MTPERDNQNLVQKVLQSLSPDGLIVASTGAYPLSGTRYVPISRVFEEQDTKYATLLGWINWKLGGDAIEKSIEYSDFMSNKYSQIRRPVQRYNILMKDKALISNWMASEADMSVALRLFLKTPATTSLLEAVDPEATQLLHYFDGAVMKTYVSPSRIAEEMWNKDNPTIAMMHGYDPEIVNYKIETSLDIRISTAKNGGRGVYATQHIDEGSYIGLENIVQNIELAPNSFALLDRFSGMKYGSQHIGTKQSILLLWFEVYGWFNDDVGRTSAGVETSLLTFVNHGCNGTNNVGERLDFTEFSLELGTEYDVAFKKEVHDSQSDYYDDRCISGWPTISVSHVDQNEEIFFNYLTLSGRRRWNKHLPELKSFCSGLLGAVSQYELSHSATQQK